MFTHRWWLPLMTIVVLALAASCSATTDGAVTDSPEPSDSVFDAHAPLPSSGSANMLCHFEEPGKDNPSHAVLQAGSGAGILRIIRSSDDIIARPPGIGDVVIMTEAFPELPVVAGLILEARAPAQSHLVQRASEWEIPNVYSAGAVASFGHLEGQPVHLQATDRGYCLRHITEDAAKRWRASRLAHRTAAAVPLPDLTTKELRWLRELSVTDAPAYGFKAASLGQIAANTGGIFGVPDGFALPAHWYLEHLSRTGLDVQIEAMLADPRFARDPEFRIARLAELREAIRTVPLAPELSNRIARRVSVLTGEASTGGYFVRTSMTGEDLSGHMGSGLYDTFPNVKGALGIAGAVQGVWASFWNDRAVAERSFRGVAHDALLPAVLVQRSVPARFSGMLTTANVFDPDDRRSITINAVPGVGLGAIAGSGKAEQMLVNRKTMEVHRLTELGEREKLVLADDGGLQEVQADDDEALTQARIKLLVTVADWIENIFPEAGPLDIEWIFADAELHVVQARLHQVRAGETAAR